MKILEQNTVTNIDDAATPLYNHFFHARWFLGLPGSDGTQVTTNGFEYVPNPLYEWVAIAGVRRARFSTILQ